MSKTSRRSSVDLRKQRNSDILRRMRNNEPLNAIDSRASWFPPRPMIKKDAKEMHRLYNMSFPEGEAPTTSAATRASDAKGASKIVRLGAVKHPHAGGSVDEAS
jgi:hypothetical protein